MKKDEEKFLRYVCRTNTEKRHCNWLRKEGGKGVRGYEEPREGEEERLSKEKEERKDGGMDGGRERGEGNLRSQGRNGV